MASQAAFPIVGYVVVPEAIGTRYRGIDRNPFEPEVLEEELSAQPGPSGMVYTLYPPGWRRDAYHLYEDALAPSGSEDVYMVGDLETARRIAAVVSPHLGMHEVMRCAIWPVGEPAAEKDKDLEGFTGFDIAYLGGDHYSAIRHGLVLNPQPSLSAEFGRFLNDASLFDTTKHIPAFLRRFQALVPSESTSEFYVHSLCGMSAVA